MLEFLTSNALLNSLGLTLVHFLWQGCAVALLLKAALMIVKKNQPQLRYGLAAMASLANLLLPICTFLLIYQPEQLSLALTNQETQLGSILSAEYLAEEGLLNNLLELTPYLSIIWLICISYLACKLIVELYFVHQLPKLNIVQPSDKLMAKFADLAKLIGLKRQPQLLISLSAKVPMALGWLKPVILLPASMVTRLDFEQLEMLLLHELAHVKRYDYLVNILQTLIEILLFYHPAVHWVSAQMRNEREYCSDDIAVQHCGNAVAYAHTLTDTAAICHHHRGKSIPTMAMAASGGDLKQRVLRLVNHHCAEQPQQGKWLAGVIVILSVLVISTQHLLTLTLLTNHPSNVLSLDDVDAPNVQHKPIIDTTINTSASLAQQLLTRDFANLSTNDNVLNIRNLNQDKENQVAGNTNSQNSNSTPNLANIQKTEETIQPTENTVNEKATTQFDIDKPVIKPVKKIAETTNLKQHDDSSIVEQAFARTDSKLTATKAEAEYKQQVQSLLAVQKQQTTFDDLSHQPLEPVLPTSTNSTQDTSKVTTERATLLKAAEPKYPTLAKRKGIELEVTVHFTIDEDGYVSNIEFEPQSKITYFRRSIKNAMEKWRFTPATINGKPVKSKMSKIFSFSLVS